jgi:osmotically-inducible protein OsmY
MANERRYGNQDMDWRDREDDGYIARRGFGNRSSGYDRGSRSDEDYDRRRERDRDFGDSAGYGTGGSALDWRDVAGDEGGYERPFSGSDRRDRGRSGFDPYRYESDVFGRGSRDYNEERGFFERAGDEVRSWFGDEGAERRRERDMREAGLHRGRGPKGYQRSDARILEDVNDRLTEDPHIDASEIDVTVTGREVTLAGTVSSRFEKRHAEDLADSISGVTHVQNNLRIQQPADAGMGGSMLSAGAAGAGSVGMPETAGAGAVGSTRRRTGGTSGSGL